MRNTMRCTALAMAILLMLPAAALAAKAKKYQVTGVVVALTEEVITIEKGKGADAEKWEIARDAATKVEGELKVGAKVTIEYTMAAANVEVKGK